MAATLTVDSCRAVFIWGRLILLPSHNLSTWGKLWAPCRLYTICVLYVNIQFVFYTLHNSSIYGVGFGRPVDFIQFVLRKLYDMYFIL